MIAATNRIWPKRCSAEDFVMISTKALVADLEPGQGRKSLRPSFKARRRIRSASYAIESCRQAAALIGKKAKPEEAQGFKQWLVSVAQKVSEAR